MIPSYLFLNLLSLLLDSLSLLLVFRVDDFEESQNDQDRVDHIDRDIFFRQLPLHVFYIERKLLFC